MSKWTNRIVGYGEESPDQLLANPQNHRLHPKHQQKVMAGALDEIGWIQDVIVNKTTGHIVDGHLRVELALREEETAVPVKYVELTPDQERKALATLDPISALADQDQDMLNELIGDIERVDNLALAEYLGDLYKEPPEEGEEAEAARQSLAERFLIPPFSVLDAKQGYWKDRKNAWLRLGIKSELGRADSLTYAESSQPPSTYEFKNQVEKQLGRKLSWQEFAEQYPEEMHHTGTSVFDPVLCEVSYSWFCPPQGKILDPFAGGSVRGVVAGFLGYDYTGIELRPEQVQANRNNWQQIASDDQAENARWVNADSRKMGDHLGDEEYDLVFSCPPYADLEVYSDDPDDLSTLGYEEFLDAYQEIIAKACSRLKPDRFAVWVIGEVRDKKGKYYGFVQDTIRAFQAAGMDYYNEVILVTPIGSNAIRAGRMFEASRKLVKGHQNALVFTNSDDPNKAIGHTIKGLAGAIAEHFNDHRRTFEAMQNILVFCNGNPKVATEAIGTPATADLDALMLETIEAGNNGEIDD